MKHTPGRWSIGIYGVNDFHSCIYSIEGIRVATVEDWTGEKEKQESEANARLIAAAPIMYDFTRKAAEEGNAEAKAIMGVIYGNT